MFRSEYLISCSRATFDGNQIGGKSQPFQTSDVKFYTTLCSPCVLHSSCAFLIFYLFFLLSTVKSIKHDRKRKLLSLNLLYGLQTKFPIWDNKISYPKWTNVTNITQTDIKQNSLCPEEDFFLWWDSIKVRSTVSRSSMAVDKFSKEGNVLMVLLAQAYKSLWGLSAGRWMLNK